MSENSRIKRGICIDYTREKRIWWNRLPWATTDLFHIVSAGITYPQPNYNVVRSRQMGEIYENLYVIEYVESGKGYIEAEGKRCQVKSGDLYIICRKTNHCYYADKDDPFKKKWLNASGQFLNAMVPKIIGDVPFAVIPLGERGKEIIDRVHERIKKVTPMDTEEMQSDVMKMILDLFVLINRYRREETEKLSIEDRIAEYIEKNICLDINVSTICERFFISPSTLYRIFMSKFGVSPKTFIIQRKIEAAKRMIATELSPVNTIAATLNFYDSHHFIRTFRAHTGMTPNEYRKSIIK